MNTPLLEDQLVSELWAQDVRFILGSKPDHPPSLPPARLIAALTESREARLQLSLIPLFLRHPEFAVHVNAVVKKNKSRVSVDIEMLLQRSGMA
jgi:hypothetical protein